jgi:hypothetical protein
MKLRFLFLNSICEEERNTYQSQGDVGLVTGLGYFYANVRPLRQVSRALCIWTNQANKAAEIREHDMGHKRDIEVPIIRPVKLQR